ncbi:hypothetical protein KKG66_11700 [bacterium]|nr:hypothetical protein [bacterium]
MKTKTLFLCFVLVLVSIIIAYALPIPTTLADFQMGGSQPDESGIFRGPGNCNCHSAYTVTGEDMIQEPEFGWSGSMMAQAMRDPLFLATMSIANQDAVDAGDLCIRCHTPVGWLEGRSTPTDGSALTGDDFEGVQCHSCHRMIEPTPLGVNPHPDDAFYTANDYPLDQIYLATLDTIPPEPANGMYVTDSDDHRRGPYPEADARHDIGYSPFYKNGEYCGTCHDVSNPAFTRNPDNSYSPNDFGLRHPTSSPYDMFPVERTFSEWKMSAYNTPTGVFAPQFGGNLDYVKSCQDCHMRDMTGTGCSQADTLRHDLGMHDFTGGNTTVPDWIATAFPGDVDTEGLDSGKVRATYMLQEAASMEIETSYEGDGVHATVTITNETGHKLPSGYPEGRRIWINIKGYDEGMNLVYESCAYDPVSAELTHDADAKIYEIKPGISTALAPVVGLSPGISFHFVLNDTIYKDNRIPPRGFTNANFTMIQSPPVGYAYPDGQYWDETEYIMPSTVRSVEATLYYQTTSKEYVEFLALENSTDTLGTWCYNLWNSHGKSAPVVMESENATVELPPLTEVTDLTLSFIDQTGNDLNFRLEWTAVNADQYRIYSAPDQNSGPWTELGVTANSYYDFAVTLAGDEDIIGFFYVVAEDVTR